MNHLLIGKVTVISYQALLEAVRSCPSPNFLTPTPSGSALSRSLVNLFIFRGEEPVFLLQKHVGKLELSYVSLGSKQIFQRRIDS